MTKILDYAKEVFDIEAQSILDLKANLDDSFEKAINAILNCKDRVVICGMGKSGIVGKKIAATLASTGTPSFFVHPGEAFHGDLGMLTPKDIFIGISNSGETDEVVKLIPSIKATGHVFISLTGNPNSTIAKNSDFHLDISVKKEACPLQLAPTSSTTTTMAMGDAIAVTLMKVKNFKPENFAKFHPGGSLGRKLLVKVKDEMRSDNLPFIDSDADIPTLINVMTSGRLGLAIVQFPDNTIGVVSDGDLRRAMAKDPQFFSLKASDICCKKPKVISSNAKLSEAEEIMSANKITTLLVSDTPNEILGVIQIYNL